MGLINSFFSTPQQQVVCAPDSDLGIFDSIPKIPLSFHADAKQDKEFYDDQINHLGSALLIDDYDAGVIVDGYDVVFPTSFKFPDGALVSGSFVMNLVVKGGFGANPIEWDDVDIYVKNKDDANKFFTINNIWGQNPNNPMCMYTNHNGVKLNVIYGVEYDSPQHLISRFDIRACSMAIDPNNNKLYLVRGSAEDTLYKKIVFNPVPRGVSVRRYAKYVKKGFAASSYQNLFFSELIKTPLYSPTLELVTKEY